MESKSIFPNTVYRVSTKAFIVNEKQELLLMKEGDWWRDLPWWWLDFYEDPKDGLQREIKEELGIESIVDNRPIYVRTQWKKSKDIHVLFLWYKTTIDSTDFTMIGNGTDKESFDERRFFSKAELSNITLHENMIKILEIYDPKDFIEIWL